MNDYFKYIFIALAVAIVIVIICLLVQLSKTGKRVKKITSKVDNINNNIDKLNTKVDYVEYVKDKTLVDETLTTLTLFADLRRFLKKPKSFKDSAIRAVKKDITKDSYSKVKDKLKAII